MKIDLRAMIAKEKARIEAERGYKDGEEPTPKQTLKTNTVKNTPKLERKETSKEALKILDNFGRSLKA